MPAKFILSLTCYKTCQNSPVVCPRFSVSAEPCRDMTIDDTVEVGQRIFTFKSTDLLEGKIEILTLSQTTKF